MQMAMPGPGGRAFRVSSEIIAVDNYRKMPDIGLFFPATIFYHISHVSGRARDKLHLFSPRF